MGVEFLNGYGNIFVGGGIEFNTIGIRTNVGSPYRNSFQSIHFGGNGADYVGEKHKVEFLGCYNVENQLVSECENQMLKYFPPTELTIAGGIITITQNYHRVDGEGDAADNLVTINGGVDGMPLVLQAENNARVITVKHGTGNIRLNAGADKPLGTQDAKLELIYNAVTSKWNQVGHSTN